MAQKRGTTGSTKLVILAGSHHDPFVGVENFEQQPFAQSMDFVHTLLLELNPGSKAPTTGVESSTNGKSKPCTADERPKAMNRMGTFPGINSFFDVWY